MNKTEKLIALLLGLGLVGWFFYSCKVDAPRRAEAARQAALAAERAAATNAAPLAAAAPAELKAPASAPVAAPAPAALQTVHAGDAQIVMLSNALFRVELTSWGAAVRAVTLQDYALEPGAISAENPAVTIGSAAVPALALTGLPGLPADADYALLSQSATNVVFEAKGAGGLVVTRTISIDENYVVTAVDSFRNAGDAPLVLASPAATLGALARSASENDILSIDSFPAGGKKITYWGSEKGYSDLLVGASNGGLGCMGSRSAAGLPLTDSRAVDLPQSWVALKSRFFLFALAASEPAQGFSFATTRDAERQVYALKELSAVARFSDRTLAAGETMTRTLRLFAGPKKLSLMRAFGGGLEDVMDFGMWSWLCKLIVPTLNGFYAVIPNYGVAIILLTILVRLIFWPLTRKSTMSMKKMSEIQPKIKELRKLYKDNPQRMQQETWAIYRENKINPLASCLPMLIQIPVFIALFYVLRNSVELRYAPFLWISDLSEPENLFAGSLPIAINILPILMAVTMGLQSYYTPSAGDAKQQRMMMIMMPAMMLFMFYSFPSALSLYWTVSQVLAIVQMIMIRRSTAAAAPAVEVVVDDADRPSTRQQRRHGR